MKLHRISVTNLNSLYDTQEIDLDADLQGASLFLVQGPTGSGKSTLMDAISLALFGTTPRWAGERSDLTIAEHVMSHGTGTCQAEVTFSKYEPEQGARVHYRAAWSARRARNKPDGNMQPTTRSLERLGPDGKWTTLISDPRAKFTDPEFDKVLEGFSAQDFQRSMLLAQGQFDAMLHAKPAERAAILERLTATETYQALGERAERMKKAWAKRISQAKYALEGLTPMSPEALTEARETAAAGEAQLETLGEQVSALEGQLRWLATGADLSAELVAANAAHAEAAAAQTAASEKLAELAEHERCAEAFTTLDRLGERQKRVQELDARVRQLALKEPELARQAAEQAEQLNAARARLKAREAALEVLRPVVQRAEESTRSVERESKELSAAEHALTEAKARFDASMGAREAAASKLEAAFEVQRACATAAQELAPHAPLAKALPELKPQVAALQAQEEQRSTEEAELAKQQAALGARAEQLEADRAAHAEAEASSVTPLERQAGDAARRLLDLTEGADVDDALARLHGEQQRLAERLTHLEKVSHRVDRREQARRVLAAQHLSNEQTARSLATAVDRQTQASTALAAARSQRDDAERQLEPLRRMETFAAARSELSSGDPCPLCGSTSHPLLTDEGPGSLGGELAAAREHLQQAEANLAAAEQARAEADRAEAAARATHDAAVARLDELSAEVSAATAHAEEGLHEADLPSQTTPEELATATAETRAQQARCGERHTALSTAQAAHKRSQKDLEEARTALADEAKRLEQDGVRIAEQRESHRRRVQELEQQTRSLAQRRSALLADLDALGAEGPTVEAALAHGEQRSQALERARERAREAESAHRLAQQALESATTAQEEARQAHGKAISAVDERREKQEQASTEARLAAEALTTAWQSAVATDDTHDPARPTEMPAPEHYLVSQKAVCAQARTRLADAETAAARASRVHQDTVRDRANATEALGSAHTEVTETEQTLSGLLEALSLTDAEALEQRRLSPDRLPALREQRRNLRDALTRANTRREEVQRRLARHAEERPAALSDDDTPETLQAALSELDTQRKALSKRLTDAQAVIKQAADQEDKIRAAEQTLAEAREQGRVWLALHELIGVGGGERFKLFAQALNLDQLLAQANRHLAQLNDRYQLVTVRDPDTRLPTLEFEIADHWRPGTTRSLKTLSGGESFLVSLALALGLSDLRTSSMPVETLLLDEGFGTLDSDTLNIALAALQQLQSTGRQVGIISHVVGLHERIEAQIHVEPMGDGRSRVRAATVQR